MSDEPKTYTVRCHCTNCGLQQEATLPFGTQWLGSKGYNCKACGCDALMANLEITRYDL